jgi:hypothetical protein
MRVKAEIGKRGETAPTNQRKGSRARKREREKEGGGAGGSMQKASEGGSKRGGRREGETHVRGRERCTCA